MPALTTTTDGSPTLQADLDELSSLLWETFRGLRQSSPPPTSLLEAGTWGSLSSRHKHALSAVATAGPLSVTELARRLGLSLSTTSALVGQLDRAGLVHRAEDATDRRRT